MSHPRLWPSFLTHKHSQLFFRSPDRLDTGGSNSSSLYDGGEFKSGYHNVGSVTAAGPDVKRVEAAKAEAEVKTKYVELRFALRLYECFFSFFFLFVFFIFKSCLALFFFSFSQEVSAQLRALLQPTTLATVQLFHRLVSIVQDLDVLMRALSADNEVFGSFYC